MNKIWKLLSSAPQSFLDEHPELPTIAANLLFNRNILTQEKIDEFLNPDYSKHVYDPYLFKDMDKATDRIFLAIKNNEKITIHGDYDADGVSASVILSDTLKALGASQVEVFLPHRETDGYGLNKKTVQMLADTGTKLIITCDCGVSNFEEIELANKNKIDVIVTDHHAVPEKLPPALAIIHPKVPGETYPDQGLAGGAVAFKLMQGLLQKHKKNGLTLLNGTTHDGFEKWLLDMAAIASVADMVPLTGESRTLSKFGLVVLNKTKRIGLQKLLLEARLVEENGKAKKELDAGTIGFQIAPRINAAGRMNHANVAYNLLTTTDPVEAAELAHDLNKNNEDRQKMTEKLVKEAVAQVEKEQKENPVLFIIGVGWSTGIVGLIAGKIKDKYYKPTLVLAINNNDITGSGRSVDGFNIIEALQKMPKYFAKFGGHPMACGFSFKEKTALEEFKNDFTEEFKIQTAGLDLTPSLAIDAEVDLDNIDWPLYDSLEKFEPFGQTNEKPKFLAKNLQIVGLEPIGKDKKHLRIMVKHNSLKVRKTIGWNLCNENNCHCCDWGKELKIGDKIDLVFEMDVNEWNGNKELQLTIVDLRISN